MLAEEFLTTNEIATLTGLVHKRAQVKWLSENGWKFITNAGGAPVISRLYCRQRMVGEIATAQIDEMPNFGAIR